jgi:hypothetical protein
MDVVHENIYRLRKPELKEKYGLADDHRLFLFASSPIYRMRICKRRAYLSLLRKTHEVFQQSLSRNPKIHLAFRPHFSELEILRSEGIAELYQKGRNSSFTCDMTIEESLVMSDAVLLVSSTVALEAMLAKVPVYVLNPDNWTLGDDYVEKRAAYKISRFDDLSDVFAGHFQCPYQLDDATSYYVANLGRSAGLMVSRLTACLESHGA